MVVTVITVSVMEAAIDNIVFVVTVRDRFIAALVMPARAIDRRAVGGGLVVDLDHMLVVVIAMGRVKMSIVHIVHMTVVGDTGMPTRVVVDVIVFAMSPMFHCSLLVSLVARPDELARTPWNAIKCHRPFQCNTRAWQLEH
jgi:hypothetical protein